MQGRVYNDATTNWGIHMGHMDTGIGTRRSMRFRRGKNPRRIVLGPSFPFILCQFLALSFPKEGNWVGFPWVVWCIHMGMG